LIHHPSELGSENIQMQNGSRTIAQRAHSHVANRRVLRQSLVYITVVWPFRSGSEVFFVPELKELCNANIDLAILPRDLPSPPQMSEVTENLSQHIHGAHPF
jgi:hypothetical protein